MSLDPILWALKDAPTADTLERVVLLALAGEAVRADGSFISTSRQELARTARVDPKTVQRTLRRLEERSLVAKRGQRPLVYDLLIPLSWFSDVDGVNAERRQAGLEPLTPENRPDIAPPPAKGYRSDLGRVLGPRRHRTDVPGSVRRAVFARDGGRCVKCGAVDDLTIDHIYPWVRGGSNHPDNLRVLCRPCNSSKGARLIDQVVSQ
ncbi:HNH endonuclease [Streptomyces sp. NPDC127172]|uniref:HNH endonuclease n=1 Tax=Streptomyces sp. NPDC127172 TaxID=3345382 RepID=UPI0036255F42